MGVQCCGEERVVTEQDHQAATTIAATRKMTVEQRKVKSLKQQSLTQIFSKYHYIFDCDHYQIFLVDESPALQIVPELEPYKVNFSKINTENLIYVHKQKVDGNIYRGQTQKSAPFLSHGIGTMLYADGKVYEGYWENGKRSGHGRLVHENGSTYIGEYSNDLANGNGVFENVQGYRYEGQWLNDALHGTGIETWADSGMKFMGAFVSSKKHGKGRFDWADGSYYEGDFEDGIFHGQGEYYFADQQKTYYGQFEKGIA